MASGRKYLQNLQAQCMKQSRILLAESAQVLSIAKVALADYELLVVQTMQQAERRIMESSIDLFAIDIHFDDSRSMDLIKVIRLEPKHKKTPIVVLRLGRSDMGDFLQRTMDVMKTVHDISDYVKLDGDPEAQKKLRKAIEKYLPSEELV